MSDPRGRSVYDDVPINGGESEFRSFDEDEGGEDLPCMSESCAAGNCDGCTDVDANCCECNCHIGISAHPQTDRTNGFDYENQAWVVGGRYVSCGHPETMNCGCFGRIHAGESPAANAEIH